MNRRYGIFLILGFVCLFRVSYAAFDTTLANRVTGGLQAMGKNPYLQSREVIYSGENSLGQIRNFKRDELDQKVSALSRKLPFVFNNSVDNFIKIYSIDYAPETEKLFLISSVFLPSIEAIIIENGLPAELKYLPLLLSTFNPVYTSELGQRGIWQLHYTNAIRYKLEIDETIDERCDIQKSTRAACKYIHALYGFYGNWPLTVAAFSLSPSMVNQSIKRYENNIGFSSKDCVLEGSLGDYWSALCALNFIGKYMKPGGLSLSTAIDSKIDKVILSSDLHLLQPAGVLNLAIERIRELNFSAKNDIIKSGRELNLPFGYASIFYSKADEIYNYRKDELLNVSVNSGLISTKNNHEQTENTIQIKKYHKIRNGESLGRVASNYGVSKSDLREWNHLTSDKLKAGQRLIVKIITREAPVNDINANENKPATIKESQSNWAVHVVKKGETLSAIGSKYGVSYQKIKEWNGLRSDNIAEGQKLKILKR